MKFQTNKEYTTRNGSIAKIFLIQKNNSKTGINALIGVIRNKNEKVFWPMNWMSNGRIHQNINTENDIIEQKETIYVNFYKDTMVPHHTKEKALKHALNNCTRKAIRFIKDEKQESN